MMYVHISAKVVRRIETLKKSGKAGNALAQKAESIIESLTSGKILHHMDPVGSFTLTWTAPVTRTDGTPLSLAEIDGQPAISYYVGGISDNLKYARWDGDSWSKVTVASGGIWNFSSSVMCLLIIIWYFHVSIVI